MFFLIGGAKQKNENENTEYQSIFIPFKSLLLKTKESYFSFVWIMEFSITSSRL